MLTSFLVAVWFVVYEEELVEIRENFFHLLALTGAFNSVCIFVSSLSKLHLFRKTENWLKAPQKASKWNLS